MSPCNAHLDAIRLYRSFALDVMRERAGGFDGELVELSEDLAEFLCVDVSIAAELLHRPYRHAMNLLNEVQV